MTKLTSEQYAQTGGVDCPECGECGCIEERGSMQVDESGTMQDCECTKCKATWQDTYKLVGYDYLETPEKS